MATVTIDTTMREAYTRFDGVFGKDLHQFMLLVMTHNNRFYTRMGSGEHAVIHGFTYRSDALKFIKAMNDEGKAEVAEQVRKATAAASTASASTPG